MSEPSGPYTVTFTDEERRTLLMGLMLLDPMGTMCSELRAKLAPDEAAWRADLVQHAVNRVADACYSVTGEEEVDVPKLMEEMKGVRDRMEKRMRSMQVTMDDLFPEEP